MGGNILNITHAMYVSFTKQSHEQESEENFFIDSLKIKSEAEFLILREHFSKAD